jgi:hypothetical protein
MYSTHVTRLCHLNLLHSVFVCIIICGDEYKLRIYSLSSFLLPTVILSFFLYSETPSIHVIALDIFLFTVYVTTLSVSQTI